MKPLPHIDYDNIVQHIRDVHRQTIDILAAEARGNRRDPRWREWVERHLQSSGGDRQTAEKVADEKLGIVMPSDDDPQDELYALIARMTLGRPYADTLAQGRETWDDHKLRMESEGFKPKWVTYKDVLERLDR